jgi:hypothetical protein
MEGNPVSVTNFAGGLVPVGRLEDVPFLYVDLGLGYWLHRNNAAHVTGIAPILELHWNRSLEDTQPLQAGPLRVAPLSGAFDTMNLVVGALVECRQNTTLTLGYATPISGGIDREFDGELRVILNHRFGPQTRASRAQF